MKYVEWVEKVAQAYASLRTDTQHLQGIDNVGEVLGSDGRGAEVFNAIQDLDQLGILDASELQWIKPTQGTRALRQGASLRELWPTIVGRYLDPEQEAMLKGLVEVSERREADVANVEEVEYQQVWDALGWDTDEHDPHGLVTGLEAIGLVRADAYLGGRIILRPTYQGVVRATERVATEWQERLDAMVAEWETTTVEFKREIELGTPKRHAEFARDVTALANTKASGALRYLIVGYDPDTHAFVRAADPSLDQDRLEQVLNAWAAPSLDIRYFTVEHQAGGQVGVVEVRRVPEKLPYRVIKAGGKIAADSIFVRHGSQVEPPTEAELAALEAEGEHPRRD